MASSFVVVIVAAVVCVCVSSILCHVSKLSQTHQKEDPMSNKGLMLNLKLNNKVTYYRKTSYKGREKGKNRRGGKLRSSREQ